MRSAQSTFRSPEVMKFRTAMRALAALEADADEGAPGQDRGNEQEPGGDDLGQREPAGRRPARACSSCEAWMTAPCSGSGSCVCGP